MKARAWNSEWMCPSKELGPQSVGDVDPIEGFKQGGDVAFLKMLGDVRGMNNS